MNRLLLLIALCFASHASAQDEEGDRPAPTRRSKSFTSTRLRAQPHWPLAVFELSLVVSGRTNVFFGVDLVAGVPLGFPTKLSRRDRIASGWTLVPVIEASFGGLGGPFCDGSRLCGQRFVIGPGLKFGHGVGIEREDGTVRPNRMVFVQVSAIGGIVDVRGAPLAPGDAWWEGGVRARAGGHLGSLDLSGESGFLSSFSLNVAVVVEYIALSRFTRGWGFGGVVGFAF